MYNSGARMQTPLVVPESQQVEPLLASYAPPVRELQKSYPMRMLGQGLLRQPWWEDVIFRPGSGSWVRRLTPSAWNLFWVGRDYMAARRHQRAVVQKIVDDMRGRQARVAEIAKELQVLREGKQETPDKWKMVGYLEMQMDFLNREIATLDQMLLLSNMSMAVANRRTEGYV